MAHKVNASPKTDHTQQDGAAPQSNFNSIRPISRQRLTKLANANLNHSKDLHKADRRTRANTKRAQEARKQFAAELGHSMREELEKKTWADLQILHADTGEFIIEVSQKILSGVSEYFSTMMHSGMRECADGVLFVEWPPVIARAMVEFMMTGHTFVHLSALPHLAMLGDEVLFPALVDSVRTSWRVELLNPHSAPFWFDLAVALNNQTAKVACASVFATYTEHFLRAMVPTPTTLNELFLSMTPVCVSVSRERLLDYIMQCVENASEEDTTAAMNKVEGFSPEVFTTPNFCVELRRTTISMISMISIGWRRETRQPATPQMPEKEATQMSVLVRQAARVAAQCSNN